MAILNFNFESQYLGNNTDISVILPDKPRELTPAEFYGSGKKYKVLWLLHGTFGDHTDWLRKSNIELYACEKDLIVVMPSCGNSDYIDWPGFTIGYNAWNYLFDELMPLIYNWFPASSKREDNFIAGLSMGGGGTIQYVAAHPEKFGGAAILSYAHANLHKVIEEYESGNPEFGERTRNVINNLGGAQGYLNSPVNVWDALPELVKSKKLPKLYFCCGEDDFLYERYMNFKKYAQEIGLDATFEETPGYSHEWRFWDISIQKALAFFGLDEDGQGNPY